MQHLSDESAVSSTPARGTVDTKSGCALPRATSLVEYYMSTTPCSRRRDRQSPNLGSPANYSGIYSVWKSPTKHWSECEGPERLESTSTDSSDQRTADREGDRSREKERAIPALQWSSQTSKVVQNDSPGMADTNDAGLDSGRQSLRNASHKAVESHSPDFVVPGSAACVALDTPTWNGMRRQQPKSWSQQAALEEALKRQQRLYDEQMYRVSASSGHASTLSSRQRDSEYVGYGAETDVQLAHSRRLAQNQLDEGIQNAYRAHEASPPPLEISQMPHGQNQEPCGGEKASALDNGSPVEVAAIGLVICNKTISVISPGNGSSQAARSPGGTAYGRVRPPVTVGLVQVHGILPNSPASRCEGIGIGDEILAVNSFSCRGRSCREVFSYLTPINTILAGQVQYTKPVHIISRRCSSARNLRPRETLCHISIVADGEQFSRYADSMPAYLPGMRPGRNSSNDIPSAGLSASLSAVEEALFEKTLTPREKPAVRTFTPGERSRSVYDTTWRTFPLISLSAETWSPADVRMFLEWVFWRQGAGFSMSTSEYHRVPAGAEMLGMTDEGFGSMGFTHDETLVIRCVLGVLRVAAEEMETDVAGFA